ncbi:uncharacterized protein LOC126322395 [Schistocerca gregaria]|uniref:uncharacterized protein LOC126322395 n=1 Tax=Schistocerca gregaria TaxID=7010 RepID=UPI00211DC02B|nr:uncharacterized protein LOC126322395 [Schistocerca gregaria]
MCQVNEQQLASFYLLMQLSPENSGQRQSILFLLCSFIHTNQNLFEEIKSIANKQLEEIIDLAFTEQDERIKEEVLRLMLTKLGGLDEMYKYKILSTLIINTDNSNSAFLSYIESLAQNLELLTMATGPELCNSTDFEKKLQIFQAVKHDPNFKDYLNKENLLEPILQFIVDLVESSKSVVVKYYSYLIPIIHAVCNLHPENKETVAHWLKSYLCKSMNYHVTNQSQTPSLLSHENGFFARIFWDLLLFQDEVFVCLHSQHGQPTRLKQMINGWENREELKLAFKFRKERSHPNLIISEDGLTICGPKGLPIQSKFLVAVSDFPISQGIVKWEVRIKQLKHSLVIGVSKKNHGFDPHYPGQITDNSGWSYCISVVDTSVMAHNGNFVVHQNPVKSGDVIKVTVDMNEGTLAFGVNETDLGIAYSNLKGSVVYPAIAMRNTQEIVEVSGYLSIVQPGICFTRERRIGYHVHETHPLRPLRTNEFYSILSRVRLKELFDDLLSVLPTEPAPKLKICFEQIVFRNGQTEKRTLSDWNQTFGQVVQECAREDKKFVVMDLTTISKNQTTETSLSDGKEWERIDSGDDVSVAEYFFKYGGLAMLLSYLEQEILTVLQKVYDERSRLSFMNDPLAKPQAKLFEQNTLSNNNVYGEAAYDDGTISLKREIEVIRRRVMSAIHWLMLMRVLLFPRYLVHFAKNELMMAFLRDLFYDVRTLITEKISEYRTEIRQTIVKRKENLYMFYRLTPNMALQHADSQYSPECVSIEILTEMLIDSRIWINSPSAELSEWEEERREELLDLRNEIWSCGALAWIMKMCADIVRIEAKDAKNEEIRKAEKKNEIEREIELILNQTTEGGWLELSSTWWETGMNCRGCVWDASIRQVQRKYQEHASLLVMLQFIENYLTVVACNADKSTSVELLDQPKLHPKVYEVLIASCLIPLLESYLRNDSLLDIMRKVDIYYLILRVIRVMIKHQELAMALATQAKNKESNWYLSFSFMKRIIEGANKLQFQTSRNISRNMKKDADSEESSNNSNKSMMGGTIDERLTLEINLTEQQIKQIIDPLLSLSQEESQEASSSFNGPGSSSTDEGTYRKELEPFQLDEIEMSVNGVYNHYYAKQIESETSVSTAKMKRLAQELGSLNIGLPLHWSSSVFIRVSSERMDVMKVVISGPVGTPYENGLFLFDVYCPAEYPKTEPLINLRTTGNGLVRFNPNLYNSGKVCLSLLGTWHGGPDEKWNEATSTLLQVFVSIQSLIFVAEPYFNEPGYESTFGTRDAMKKSKAYNETIQLATLKWAILDPLKNPYPGFEDVIRIHFKLKSKAIKKCCNRWLQESFLNSREYCSKILGLSKEIASIIADLE